MTLLTCVLLQDPQDARISVATLQPELALYIIRTGAVSPRALTAAVEEECRTFLRYNHYSNYTIDCNKKKNIHLKVCNHR